MRIEWRGEGVDEVGVDAATGRTLVRVDPRYFRPTEVETLLGDPSKARHKLGWSAEIELLRNWWRKWSASDLAGRQARCHGRERRLQDL